MLICELEVVISCPLEFEFELETDVVSSSSVVTLLICDLLDDLDLDFDIALLSLVTELLGVVS